VGKSLIDQMCIGSPEFAVTYF